jgi:ATP adenylyltransferase
MDYLWTPWRMAYVSGAGGAEPAGQSEAPQPEKKMLPPDDEESCIFCVRAHKPPQHDRDSLIVLRAKRNFVILNLYPYNTGHLMVVPYEHTADFARLDRETAEEMMALAQRMVGVLGEEYRPEGFNLGMNLGRVSGAGVADHLHLHVVPRWAGDTNFMPIVGGTKVMPELPETTLDRLHKRMQADGGSSVVE